MNRRGFLSGILAACVAPAIVRADSLMRIVPMETTVIHEELEDIIWNIAPPETPLYVWNDQLQPQWEAVMRDLGYFNHAAHPRPKHGIHEWVADTA